jgi:hypothetical protein
VTVCPFCRSSPFFPEHGDVTCSQCGWVFAIDPRGAVIAGVPIDCECPSCRNQMGVYPHGPTTCTQCEATFFVDMLGRVFTE